MHTDGTEDGEIHCLKEGGVAAGARKTIERDTAALATATDSLEESDPFADVEEDEELEENELLLEFIILCFLQSLKCSYCILFACIAISVIAVERPQGCLLEY